VSHPRFNGWTAEKNSVGKRHRSNSESLCMSSSFICGSFEVPGYVVRVGHPMRIKTKYLIPNHVVKVVRALFLDVRLIY
jgi:hypothetical protein